MTQQINLFNPAFLKQKKIFSAVAMAQALAVLLVASLALGFYGRYHTAQLQVQADDGAATLAKKKEQYEKAKLEFPPRQKDPAIDAMINAALAEQGVVRELIGVLEGDNLGNTTGYSPLFSALARQSMERLWLTGLSIEGAGNHIDLRGKAMEADLVPIYMTRLKRESVLQGKDFGGLQIVRPNRAVTADKNGPASVELAPFVDFHLQATNSATTPAAQKPADPAPPAAAANDIARVSK